MTTRRACSCHPRERGWLWPAAFAGAAAVLILLAPARGEIALSANDGKTILIDGKLTVSRPARRDGVSIIDLAGSPRVTFELPAPSSVYGPPTSVAIARDESFAVVTAATRLDPKDRGRTLPGDTVSVIDLKGKAPRIAQTVKGGIGASGVAIAPAGNLVLVANRGEGTVSVFTVANRKLTPQGKINLGSAQSGPSGIAFTPDGTSAFVTRDGDSTISVLRIEPGKISDSGRALYAGLKPYAIDIAADGSYGAVANIGMGAGDADTISLIDVKAQPPRVVDTITVGPTPEGLRFSPDGQFIAVSVINGSDLPRKSPFFRPRGTLAILLVSDGKLKKVTEAPTGRWCQGTAWSGNGKTVLVQCMVEREIQVFAFDGYALKRKTAIRLNTGPAAIATAR